jgi:hypothetical protein
VLGVGSLLGITDVLGSWIGRVIGWYLEGSPSAPSSAIVRGDQECEFQEYKAVIDALYDRAEQEVRRLTQEQ